MKKILTIGSAIRDIFIHYKHTEMMHLNMAHQQHSFLILEEGNKTEIDSLAYYTGGGATNSAVSFKRLGFEVAALFKIGNDQDGTHIIQELQHKTIDIHYALHTPDASTAQSFIIPTPRKDRIVLVHRGANLTLTEKDLPFTDFSQFDHLYVTSLSGPTAKLLLPISQHAKKNNIPLAINPGTSQLSDGADILRDSLPNIDIVILNSFEAQLCMSSLTKKTKRQSRISQKIQHDSKNDTPKLLQAPITYQPSFFNVKNFFEEMLSRGPRIVVVTNGAEGVYVAYDNHIIFHPSLPVPVVNTLGAGDAFGSCFVASLIHGKSVENALRCGIINSASVISYLDAKTGLLTQKELTTKFTHLDPSLIQHFKL